MASDITPSGDPVCEKCGKWYSIGIACGCIPSDASLGTVIDKVLAECSGYEFFGGRPGRFACNCGADLGVSSYPDEAHRAHVRDALTTALRAWEREVGALAEKEREAICIGDYCELLPVPNHNLRCTRIANEVERIVGARERSAGARALEDAANALIQADNDGYLFLTDPNGGTARVPWAAVAFWLREQAGQTRVSGNGTSGPDQPG